jgi:hypothetical protein
MKVIDTRSELPLRHKHRTHRQQRLGMAALNGLIHRLGRDPTSKRRPGLLWIGSPCSPWKFYTRVHTGRSAEMPRGNEDNAYCEKHNILAEHLAIACKKARREGARWAWETTANGGSDLWRYQPVRNMLQSGSASSVNTHACAFMERSEATGKIYSIKSSAGSKAALQKLRRPCVFSPGEVHPVSLMRKTSTGKVQGNVTAMQTSSEYTHQFASAVVVAYFPS